MCDLHFPLRLVPNKDYWVYVTENKNLAVRLGATGEDLPCLSETEQVLFQYLCAIYRGEPSPVLDTARIDKAVLDDLDQSFFFTSAKEKF
jgi:hypothetical protein